MATAVIAATLLAHYGSGASESAVNEQKVAQILKAADVEVSSEVLRELMSQVGEKGVESLLAEGSKLKSSNIQGGGAAPAADASVAAAKDEAPAAAEEEEEDDDMGFSLFD